MSCMRICNMQCTSQCTDTSTDSCNGTQLVQEVAQDGAPALLVQFGAFALQIQPSSGAAESAWQSVSEDAAATFAALSARSHAHVPITVPPTQLQAAQQLAAAWANVELALEVRASVKDTTPWAPAGHIIASEQFDMSDTLRGAADTAAYTAADNIKQDNTGAQAEPQVLLAARVRQNGNIVVKAWDVNVVSDFYATRTATETRAALGAALWQLGMLKRCVEAAGVVSRCTHDQAYQIAHKTISVEATTVTCVGRQYPVSAQMQFGCRRGS